MIIRRIDTHDGDCNFCLRKHKEVWEAKSGNESQHLIIHICDACLQSLMRLSHTLPHELAPAADTGHEKPKTPIRLPSSQENQS